MKKLSLYHRVVIALFISCGLLPSSAIAAVRTVALSGQQAPDAPAGAVFDELFTAVTATPIPPSMNAAGRTASAATLTIGLGGVAGPNDTGIWSEGGGALALVAREGSSAPGGPAGANYLRVLNPVINNAGQVAFSGRMRDGGVATTNDDALWLSSAGVVTLLAREGSAAPSTSDGVVFATFVDPTLNTAGSTAFRATLTGTGVVTANNAGIWAHRGGSLVKVMRLGEAAPGAGEGLNFGAFVGASSPLLNNANQVAFRALLAGTGVTTSNDGSIWVERNGALTMVAREGSPAPGAEGRNFANLTDPVLNSGGQLAFVSTLTGAPAATNVGLWVENNNILSLVLQKGAAATAAGPEITFNNFATPMFNGSGDLGFVGTLAGAGVTTSNDTSLWGFRDGAPRLVAREGSAAPGVPAGLTFSAFASHAFNAAGQLAFLGTLAGTGITTANDKGIWAETVAGQLQLIAREGDMLQVAAGQNRTISELFFAAAPTTDDGRRTGLNDRGDVGFLATFTDSTSGVFVSDVVRASNPADFDGDGDADGADFLAWQRGFGTAAGATKAMGDANGDGAVTGADFGIWTGGFGEAAAQSAAAAVPEPATLALAGLAVAALAGAARRRNC